MELLPHRRRRLHRATPGFQTDGEATPRGATDALRLAWVRLEEKGGKVLNIPAHHQLEAFLKAYLDVAGLRGNKKGPLFRSVAGRTKVLAPKGHEPRRRLPHDPTTRSRR